MESLEVEDSRRGETLIVTPHRRHRVVIGVFVGVAVIAAVIGAFFGGEAYGKNEGSSTSSLTSSRPIHNDNVAVALSAPTEVKNSAGDGVSYSVSTFGISPTTRDNANGPDNMDNTGTVLEYHDEQGNVAYQVYNIFHTNSTLGMVYNNTGGRTSVQMSHVLREPSTGRYIHITPVSTSLKNNASVSQTVYMEDSEGASCMLHIFDGGKGGELIFDTNFASKQANVDLLAGAASRINAIASAEAPSLTRGGNCWVQCAGTGLLTGLAAAGCVVTAGAGCVIAALTAGTTAVMGGSACWCCAYPSSSWC